MLDVLKIAKLVGILTTSQIIDASLLNPDVGRPYDKNVVEFCDSNLHQIIPTKFSRIDNVGHGLFLGWSTNAEDRYQYGTKRTLFNAEGKLLPVKVPERTELVNVFWLGKEADRDPNLQLNELTPDAIFRYVTSDHLFGLCDGSGKEILPAKYGWIGRSLNGKSCITDKGPFRTPIQTDAFYIFDCYERHLKKMPFNGIIRAEYLCDSEGLIALNARKHLTKNGSALSKNEAAEEKSGYIDEDGNYAIQANFQSEEPFYKGIAAVTLADQPKNGSTKAYIDRTGKIVSPDSLEIQEFHGDYAIARHLATKPPRYGIVNRKFQPVVPFRYQALSAVNAPYNTTLCAVPECYFQPAKFYQAKESEESEIRLITATGQELFKLPMKTGFLNFQSATVLRLKNFETGEYSYVNMKGRLVANPTPESVDKDGHYIQYQNIAPQRFLKLVSLDNGHFAPDWWKGDHNRLVTKQADWELFLKEFDLIGMPRARVLELLGTGVGYDKSKDRYCYVLSYYCTGGSFVEVQLKNEKVESWSFWDDGKQVSEWFTEDMVITPGSLAAVPKKK